MTTPPPGPAPGPEHLDLDTLAELDARLLPEQVAAEHDRHLADCPQCRDAAARLRQTRALLSGLPAEPMPAAVESRLESALRGATTTIVPLDPPRAGRRSHPSAAALSAAAAAAALIAAVVLGTTLHSSGGHRSGPAQAAGVRTPSAARPTNYPVLARGEHYTRANAPRLVQGLVAAVSAASPAPAAGAQTRPTVPSALAQLYASRAQLQQCVTRLTGNAATTPLGVDFGYYSDKTVGENKPALVILLPGLSAGNADAYIVGPDCATAPDNNLYLYQAVSASS